MRIYHYACNTSCADFSLKMHQKGLAAGTRLGRLQHSHKLRSWILAARVRIIEGEGEKTGRDGQLKEGHRGRRNGKEGKEKGRRNLAPLLFLKVGTYAWQKMWLLDSSKVW